MAGGASQGNGLRRSVWLRTAPTAATAFVTDWGSANGTSLCHRQLMIGVKRVPCVLEWCDSRRW